MLHFKPFILLVVIGSLLVCGTHAERAWTADRPNVVLMLADDLGYGDVSPLNPNSMVETPAFARLASQGITFADAHTPSAVCTPTRYGLLTGRYCWRTRLKSGVLNGYGPPLLSDGQPTLGHVMQSNGYHTTVIGKWHLGLGLPGEDRDVDLSQKLTHHPGHVGFERSYVIPASLDFPPYAYFENGKATAADTVMQPKQPFPAFLREGPRAVNFDMRGALRHLTQQAVKAIEAMREREQPSFLYFPLTAPHKPVLPAEQFIGTSGQGLYGDFVRQVDATVGQLLAAIDDNQLSDHTILIVTSDNGSFMYRLDDRQQTADHLSDSSIQGYRSDHHTPNADLRGTKADIWEAGHRVPFFVRLPRKQHAGQRVDAVVGLVDVLATLTEFCQLKPVERAGPDSVSFASLLTDPTSTHEREPLICHSASGMFAVRHGKWKLVAGNGSGGREKPKGKPFGEPWSLYDLERDRTESMNVATAHPQVLARLSKIASRIQASQRLDIERRAQKMKISFDMCDENSDDKIDRQEWTSKGQAATFWQLDLNRDQQLSLNEFSKAVP